MTDTLTCYSFPPSVATWPSSNDPSPASPLQRRNANSDVDGMGLKHHANSTTQQLVRLPSIDHGLTFAEGLLPLRRGSVTDPTLHAHTTNAGANNASYGRPASALSGATGSGSSAYDAAHDLPRTSAAYPGNPLYASAGTAGLAPHIQQEQIESYGFPAKRFPQDNHPNSEGSVNSGAPVSPIFAKPLFPQQTDSHEVQRAAGLKRAAQESWPKVDGVYGDGSKRRGSLPQGQIEGGVVAARRGSGSASSGSNDSSSAAPFSHQSGYSFPPSGHAQEYGNLHRRDLDEYHFGRKPEPYGIPPGIPRLALSDHDGPLTGTLPLDAHSRATAIFRTDPSGAASVVPIGGQVHSAGGRAEPSISRLKPPAKETPYSRSPELKVSHKMAERKRRKEMKELFDDLRDSIPTERGIKCSKWEVLSKAIEYIAKLTGEKETVEKDLQDLRHHVYKLEAALQHAQAQQAQAQQQQASVSPTSAHGLQQQQANMLTQLQQTNSWNAPPSGVNYPGQSPGHNRSLSHPTLSGGTNGQTMSAPPTLQFTQHPSYLSTTTSNGSDAFSQPRPPSIHSHNSNQSIHSVRSIHSHHSTSQSPQPIRNTVGSHQGSLQDEFNPFSHAPPAQSSY